MTCSYAACIPDRNERCHCVPSYDFRLSVECSHMSSEQTFFEWMGTEFVTKKSYYEHRRHHIQPILFRSALEFFPSHLCPIEGYSVGSSLEKWRWKIHLLFHACLIFYTVMDISFFHQYCWAALDSFRSDRNVQMNRVRLACFCLVRFGLVWFGYLFCLRCESFAGTFSLDCAQDLFHTMLQRE